jgi:hypothetical protein
LLAEYGRFGGFAALIALRPDNTGVGRTGASARWFRVMTLALDAFVGINVVNPAIFGVIPVVHNRANRTFVDTAPAGDAQIGDFYSHFATFIKELLNYFIKTTIKLI